MSKEHKKVYWILNHVEQLRILVSVDTGCVFIFAFASLVCILVGIATSAVMLKI